MTDTINHLGGTFVQPGYLKKLMKNDGIDVEDEVSVQEDELRKYEEKAKMKFLALTFLSGAKADQYGDLLVDLENDSLKGYDNFPNNVVEAYHMMANYATKRKPAIHVPKRYGKPHAVGFLQEGVVNDKSAVPGTDGVVHSNIKCYACQKKGHYADKCPHSMFQHRAPASLDTSNREPQDLYGTDDVNVDPELLGFGFMQMCMTQNDRYAGLNRAWVLLDTQSNVDIFCNKHLLKDVRRIEGPGLHLRSNGGTMIANMIGDIPGYGTVWFHPRSLANILSFSNIRKRFNVHMNTGPNDPNPSIVVFKPNGKKVTFSEHSMGLYVHNTNNKTLRIII